MGIGSPLIQWEIFLDWDTRQTLPLFIDRLSIGPIGIYSRLGTKLLYTIDGDGGGDGEPVDWAIDRAPLYIVGG